MKVDTVGLQKQESSTYLRRTALLDSLMLSLFYLYPLHVYILISYERKYNNTRKNYRDKRMIFDYCSIRLRPLKTTYSLCVNSNKNNILPCINIVELLNLI